MQEFQHLIEARRIGVAFQHYRKELLQVFAEQIRLAQRFARAHPVDVAAQGVDLAVVGDKAERMGQRPGRESIGREALMDQRERADHARVAQIRKHLIDLSGGQHAFVDHRAMRQARDVKQRLLRDAAVPHRMFDAFANDVELALEGFVTGDIVAATDEQLAEARFAGARGRPDHGIVAGHVAPAE